MLSASRPCRSPIESGGRRSPARLRLSGAASCSGQTGRANNLNIPKHLVSSGQGGVRGPCRAACLPRLPIDIIIQIINVILCGWGILTHSGEVL